jgi:phosphoglycerate dehydrogenase-like enzyme
VKVVVSGASLPPDVVRDLETAGLAVETVPGDLDERAMVRALRGAWGYVLGGFERMPRSAWPELPELRVVSFMGTGHQSFLELPAGPSQITFTYTPHVNAPAVAEFTIGLMLHAVRGIGVRAGEVVRGRWSQEGTPSLLGATLGVVGLGHVGREVARMARAAFGMRVVAWNRTHRPEVAAAGCDLLASPLEVCREADVVSIHCAYEPNGNGGMIGREELRALGPDGVLVNAARAELIDPGALREALAGGVISRAALDGYYIEPAPRPAADPHGLLRLGPDRLLVTPHCAAFSRQAARRMAETVAESLIAAARGQRVPHLIPGAKPIPMPFETSAGG